MLAPIDPKTGKAVPKKDREKFLKEEGGYAGRPVDFTRPEVKPRPKHPGLRAPGKEKADGPKTDGAAPKGKSSASNK